MSVIDSPTLTYRELIVDSILHKFNAEFAADRPGHCMKLTGASEDVLLELCRQVRRAYPHLDCFVLGASEQDDPYIDAFRLIELRNAGERSLLVLRPASLRTAAEDSFNNATFTELPIDNIEDRVYKELLRRVPPERRAAIDLVLAQVKKSNPLTAVNTYLLTLHNAGWTPEAIGLGLYQVGLLPDSQAAENPINLPARLNFNFLCIEAMGSFTLNLHDRLLRLPLTAEAEIRPLIARFLKKHAALKSTQQLLERVYSESSELYFEHWAPAILELSEDSKVKVTFYELRGHDGNLRQDEDGLLLSCNEVNGMFRPSAVTIRVGTMPKPARAPQLAAFRVELWRVLGARLFEYNDVLVKFKVTSAASDTRTKKFELDPVRIEEGTYFFRILALDVHDNVLNQDDDFRDPATQAAWMKEKRERGDQADRGQFAGLLTCDSEPFRFIHERDVLQPPTPNLERRARVANVMQAWYKARIDYLMEGKVDDTLQRDREAWKWIEPGGQSLHRIFHAKLDHPKYNFQIEVSEKLRRLELELLQNPEKLGLCTMRLRGPGPLEENSIRLSDSVVDPGFASEFIAARSALFGAILTDSEAPDAPGIVETFELHRHRALLERYVETYAGFLERVRINLGDYVSLADEDKRLVSQTAIALQNLDLIEVKAALPNQESLTTWLISPLHPLRLAWALLLEELFEEWSQRTLETRQLQYWKNSDLPLLFTAGWLSPGNHPLVLVGDDGIANFEYAGELTHGWGVYLKSMVLERDLETMSGRSRIILQYLQNLLNVPASRLIDTDVDLTVVSDQIRRYLQLHPYVEQLNLNLFNVGEGDVFAEVLEQLQLDKTYEALRYEVRLFTNRDRFVEHGAAFNALLNPDSNLAETSEAFSTKPLIPFQPKLRVSINAIDEYMSNASVFDAHISFLVNPFPLRTTIHNPAQSYSSMALKGLFVSPRVEWQHFQSTGESTWSRFLIVESEQGTPAERQASHALNCLNRLVAFNLGKSAQSVPCTQLQLLNNDVVLLDQLHRYSDWVVTFDRHLGPEVFDNPGSDGVIPFLLDYLPGEQLLGVSTFLTLRPDAELHSLVEPHLAPFQAPSATPEELSRQIERFLIDLRMVSSSLILQLAGQANRVTETMGIALTKRLLEKLGILEERFLVPIDLHQSLFAATPQPESRQRADLLLIHMDAVSRRIECQVIEVKTRFETDLAARNNLMEGMDAQMSNTVAVLRTHFDPQLQPTADRFDRQIKNLELRDLLVFYAERARRYGMLSDENARECMRMLYTLDEGFEWRFEKKGVIFDLTGEFGLQKHPAQSDLTYFIVGKRTIRRLIDLDSDLHSRRLDEDEAKFSELFRRVRSNPLFSAVETEPSVASVSVPLSHAPEADGPRPEVNGTELPALITSDSFEAEVPTSTVLSNETERIVSEAPVGDSDTSGGESRPAPTIPMPPSAVENWRIRLGVDVHKNRDLYYDPFSMEPKKLSNQHILIVGKSGAGKSQTTSGLLYEIHRCGVPFLILDFQGEYLAANLANAAGRSFLQLTRANVLDPSDGMDVNPLQIPTDEFTGRKQNFIKTVYQIAAILDSVFGLGDIQHSNLRNAIQRVYLDHGFVLGQKETWENPAPDFQAIWEALQELERTEGNQIRNLRLRVQPLFDNQIFTGSHGASVEAMLHQNTIIRLATLPTVELMRAVSRFTLQSVYNYMLAAGPTQQIRLFVVIDEAHKLSYDQTLTDLIREARKYGIAFILASQSVRDFDVVVFENMGTKIALQLEGDNAKIMADHFGLLDKAERDRVQHLLQGQQPGRALIRNNHYEPFRQVDVEMFWRKN